MDYDDDNLKEDAFSDEEKDFDEDGLDDIGENFDSGDEDFGLEDENPERDR